MLVIKEFRFFLYGIPGNVILIKVVIFGNIAEMVNDKKEARGNSWGMNRENKSYSSVLIVIHIIIGMSVTVFTSLGVLPCVYSQAALQHRRIVHFS